MGDNNWECYIVFYTLVSKGSLTFGSAGFALPSHFHHFYAQKSLANAHTTKCKRP